VDSLLIRIGAYCANDFNPVCGCDNITYRNTCLSQNAGIINFTDGPCEPIAINIFTNPVASFADIAIRLRSQDKVNLWIFDSHGRQYFFESYTPSRWLDLLLDVSGYPFGVYMIIAQTGMGSYAFQKMVKQEYN
jgi:hypothetical protein